MTVYPSSLPIQQEEAATPPIAARGQGRVSRTAHAINWYVNLTMISAGASLLIGIGGAVLNPDTPAANTPAGFLLAILLIGGLHPVIVAVYLAKLVAGERQLSIGDSSQTCHWLFWLFLAPYVATMAVTSTRRFITRRTSGLTASMVLPLCAASFMIVAGIIITYLKTVV